MINIYYNFDKLNQFLENKKIDQVMKSKEFINFKYIVNLIKDKMDNK